MKDINVQELSKEKLKNTPKLDQDENKLDMLMSNLTISSELKQDSEKKLNYQKSNLIIGSEFQQNETNKLNKLMSNLAISHKENKDVFLERNAVINVTLENNFEEKKIQEQTPEVNAAEAPQKIRKDGNDEVKTEEAENESEDNEQDSNLDKIIKQEGSEEVNINGHSAEDTHDDKKNNDLCDDKISERVKKPENLEINEIAAPEPKIKITGVLTPESASSDDSNNESEDENAETKDKSAQNEDDDDNSSEDESKYLSRAPVPDHRNHNYRHSPIYPQPNSGYQQNSSQLRTAIHKARGGSTVFDVKFSQQQPPCNDAVTQGYGFTQSPSYFGNIDGYTLSAQLSPESVHSQNSSSPFYSTNYSANLSPNSYGYQSEFSNDSWPCSTPSLNSDSPSYDYSNNNNYVYDPISPPQSVSPHLKDDQDILQNGPFSEPETLNESEDLINIINDIKSFKTNTSSIPECELEKLRSVLEGDEESIRKEMGIMYLKEDASHYQPSFGDINESSYNIPSADYGVSYALALTPPKSVSPVQDEFSSPLHDYKSQDFDTYDTENLLNDIANGFNGINPEELDIYLNDKPIVYDPSYAKGLIHSRCKPNNLDHALRRLSSISLKYLCKKDDDGDTCLMIVYSKPENSPDFYENIYCLQEKVGEIRVCCDTPLGKAKRCKVCGNTDPAKFYTPLSLKNKQGDTALTCAVKTNHSPLIIDYLLHGIMQCPEDFRRVFDEKGRAVLAEVACKYQCLSKYV